MNNNTPSESSSGGAGYGGTSSSSNTSNSTLSLVQQHHSTGPASLYMTGTNHNSNMNNNNIPSMSSLAGANTGINSLGGMNMSIHMTGTSGNGNTVSTSSVNTTSGSEMDTSQNYSSSQYNTTGINTAATTTTNTYHSMFATNNSGATTGPASIYNTSINSNNNGGSTLNTSNSSSNLMMSNSGSNMGGSSYSINPTNYSNAGTGNVTSNYSSYGQDYGTQQISSHQSQGQYPSPHQSQYQHQSMMVGEEDHLPMSTGLNASFPSSSSSMYSNTGSSGRGVCSRPSGIDDAQIAASMGLKPNPSYSADMGMVNMSGQMNQMSGHINSQMNAPMTGSSKSYGGSKKSKDKDMYMYHNNSNTSQHMMMSGGNMMQNPHGMANVGGNMQPPGPNTTAAAPKATKKGKKTPASQAAAAAGLLSHQAASVSGNNMGMMRDQMMDGMQYMNDPSGMMQNGGIPMDASYISNRQMYADHQQMLAQAAAVAQQQQQKDENATSSLTKRRGPLLSRLTTFEQQNFLARKGFPFHHVRQKTQWDYFLDEMQWMAIDFRQELRWKQAMAKQLAYACKEARDERFSTFAMIRKHPTRDRKNPASQGLRDICSKISSMFVEKWQCWEAKLKTRLSVLDEAKSCLSTLNSDSSNSDSCVSVSDSNSSNKRGRRTTIKLTTVSAEFVEELIEKVLSIPSVLHTNAVTVANYAFPPAMPEFLSEDVNGGSLNTKFSSPLVFGMGLSSGSGKETVSVKMMDHQETIFRDILRLGALGYGSMIYGSSYSGKTVSVSYALIYWLIEELRMQYAMEGKRWKQNQVSYRPPVCGVVFATLHGVWHWLLVLQQYCKEYIDVRIWNEDDVDLFTSKSSQAANSTNSGETGAFKSASVEDGILGEDCQSCRSGFPTILLVPIEKYEVFCQSSIWEMLLPQLNIKQEGKESSEQLPVVKLGGVVVDLRGSQRYFFSHSTVMLPKDVAVAVETDTSVSSSATESKQISVDSKLAENQKHYKVVVALSALLPISVNKRILITDDSFRVIDRVSALSFLIPGIPYQQFYERFHTSDSNNAHIMETYKKNPESHVIPLEQVNKNTLHQLLINLSIHAIIPSDLNTRAYAQIREETTIVELTPAQQKKYDETTAVLVRSGHYNGADIEKLARILSLLKLICFHSDLVTVRKVPNQVPANFQPANSTQFFFYKPTLSKAAQLAANQDSNPSSMATLFSQGPLVGKISFLPHLKHTSVANSSQIRPFSPYLDSQSSVGISTPPNPNSGGIGDILVEGSNKLKALRSLLQRFDGLRVVIVASHWAELTLIHQYLVLQGIEHIYPHLFLKYGQQSAISTSWSASAMNAAAMDNADKPSNPFSDKPNMEKLFWLAQESNIQLFNDPSVLSSILLTTFHAFQSPSTSPWLADAVILLSHHWDSYYDLKNCFRMRLLHTGPQGDPVTVVRVCSKNTIEEVLCKQKVGVPQLQGQRLTDIHFTIKDMSPLLASLELDIGQSATSFLKNAPTMPAIRPGHSIHNSYGGINTASHNNLFSLIHSPSGENSNMGPLTGSSQAGSGVKSSAFFNDRSLPPSSLNSGVNAGNIQQQQSLFMNVAGGSIGVGGNIIPGSASGSSAMPHQGLNMQGYGSSMASSPMPGMLPPPVLTPTPIPGLDTSVTGESTNSPFPAGVANNISASNDSSNNAGGNPIRRRSGGGKGMIILGPQGRTQFVKENQAPGGPPGAAVAGRSGIWSALYLLDEEQQRSDESKEEKQKTVQWLQVFQNHLQLGLCELSCLPQVRATSIAVLGVLGGAGGSALDQFYFHQQQLQEEQQQLAQQLQEQALDLKQGGKSRRHQQQLVIATMNEMIIYQIYRTLQLRDAFIRRQQQNDSGGSSTLMEVENDGECSRRAADLLPLSTRRPRCEMAVNMLFLQTVYKQLLEREDDANSGGDGLNIKQEQAESKVEDAVVNKTICSSATMSAKMDKEALRSLGIGVSQYDAFMTQNLFVIPSKINSCYTSTIDDDNQLEGPQPSSGANAANNSTNNNATSNTNSSSSGGGGLHRSLGLTMFKDYIYDAMRSGLSVGTNSQVEPWLFVNPLQVACRHEVVKLPSYLETNQREDLGIKLRYMVKGANVKTGGYKKGSRGSNANSNASSNAAGVAMTTAPIVNPDSFDMDMITAEREPPTKSTKKSGGSARDKDYHSSTVDDDLYQHGGYHHMTGVNSMSGSNPSSTTTSSNKKRDRMSSSSYSSVPDTALLMEDYQGRVPNTLVHSHSQHSLHGNHQIGVSHEAAMMNIEGDDHDRSHPQSLMMDHTYSANSTTGSGNIDYSAYGNMSQNAAVGLNSSSMGLNDSTLTMTGSPRVHHQQSLSGTGANYYQSNQQSHHHGPHSQYMNHNISTTGMGNTNTNSGNVNMNNVNVNMNMNMNMNIEPSQYDLVNKRLKSNSQQVSTPVGSGSSGNNGYGVNNTTSVNTYNTGNNAVSNTSYSTNSGYYSQLPVSQQSQSSSMMQQSQSSQQQQHYIYQQNSGATSGSSGMNTSGQSSSMSNSSSASASTTSKPITSAGITSKYLVPNYNANTNSSNTATSVSSSTTSSSALASANTGLNKVSSSLTSSSSSNNVSNSAAAAAAAAAMSNNDSYYYSTANVATGLNAALGSGASGASGASAYSQQSYGGGYSHHSSSQKSTATTSSSSVPPSILQPSSVGTSTGAPSNWNTSSQLSPHGMSSMSPVPPGTGTPSSSSYYGYHAANTTQPTGPYILQNSSTVAGGNQTGNVLLLLLKVIM